MQAIKQKKHETDMCNGPLFSKIVAFFIPVMLSNMLQLVYNAADQMIVGKFSGSRDLAAVGSTASLINLITCILTGLSVGASSVTARHYGAGNKKSLSRTVHTSVAASLIFSFAFGAFGFLFAKPLLRLMGTPADVLDKAALYMRILFAGLPAIGLFNFASAILRAIGDTKRPMIFLVLSGLINVGLNLFFVIVFQMAVAGVALATVISQAIAATLTVFGLVKSEGDYKLHIKNIRIHKAEFRRIAQIGIPAGIQAASFSLSNVFIQSAINSFGPSAMAGCTAASNIDNLIYQATNSLYHTILAFAGQNYGAGKKNRIVKSVLYCMGIVTVFGSLIGIFCTMFSESLLSLFMDSNENPVVYAETVRYGMERLRLTCPVYFLCGIMEIGTGALRAINKSAVSMAISIMGACVFRVFWIYTVFTASHSVFTLFLSYPISWIITALCLYGMFIYYMRKYKPQKAL